MQKGTDEGLPLPREARALPAAGERQAAHLETLHRLTDRLYRANGLEAVLDAALDAMLGGLGCGACAILLRDGEGAMRCVAWRGLSDRSRETLEGHTPWPPDTVEPLPLFIGDIAQSAEGEMIRQAVLAEDMRSIAFIPITAQGRIIGDIVACHRDANACSDSCRTLAVTIARQLGFSLERVMAERHHMTALGELTGRQEDGRDIPLDVGVNPILTPDGTRTIRAMADITERQQAEAQRDLLLAELNHRVKNTLAVVQGLAYQTFRDGEAPSRRAFEGRLQALATAHDLLTRSHWDSASLDQLVQDTLQPGGPQESRIEASGPPVRLSPHAALAISLALHELFTNALKHGALSHPAGRVRLEWCRVVAEGKLRISWREQDGPAVSSPQYRGFGSLLLERSLAHDLDGCVTLAFEPSGVVCVIEMPISDPGGKACRG